MRQSRYLPIIGGVLLLHGVLLWGLNSGLLHRAVEIWVPITAIAEMVEQPKVKPLEPPPPPPKPQEHVKPPLAAAMPVPVAAPLPQAIPDAAPVPTAITGTTAVQAAAPRLLAAPPEAAPAAAVQKVELPSSDADYLHNPKPLYPPLSKRRNEQGKVVVHVLIGVDGTAQKADIKASSGFERLDKAALETVLSWRYVPGKRAGVPEPMWFNVPINFVLE